MPPWHGKTEVIANYNIVRQQCAACKSSATGCCLNAGHTPNPLVQYLSHKTSPTLEDCESRCHAFRPSAAAGSAECHSFIWNSANKDCFGRLDARFDANNSKYKDSPGIYSGTFLANATGTVSRHTLAAGGDAATAREGGHEGASQPTSPAPPPFGHFSTTNIWGKRLVNSSIALLFVNVGPTESPPLSCDPSCLQQLLGAAGMPAAGAVFRVRDLWVSHRAHCRVSAGGCRVRDTPSGWSRSS